MSNKALSVEAVVTCALAWNQMKLKFFDWVVFGALAAIAINSRPTVVLLAIITGLLYFIVRLYFSTSKRGVAALLPDNTEFIVHESDKHGVVDRSEVEVDVDINYLPAPHHFRLASRFDLGSSKSEYEYKIEGTSVYVRLLNDRNEGESSNFKEEWEVRDGVVLETDMRARFAAKEFKWGNIDEEIVALKKCTEWAELLSWSFNGLKYFLLKRNLPASDARRYLRQELERLKLGNSRAVQEFATYGIEPDPNPDSMNGWRVIEGIKPKDDIQPFWDMVKTGTLGVTPQEVGRDGQKLILDLQKLLGDTK
jgi:hypothetical protein